MSGPYDTGYISKFQGIVGDGRTDPLTNPGYKWGAPGLGVSAAITFSFPAAGAVWHPDYTQYLDNEPFNGFEAFTAEQQQAARSALAGWSSVANITFTEVADTPSDVGDIRFGNSQSVTNSTSAAWAYLPFTEPIYSYPESGDVWFDKAYAPNLELAPGQFGYSTMVHEIGHAIGLDHPHNDGAGEPTLPSAQDNQRYTIMSYNVYSGATIEAYGPMLYDILAIQRIYGANMSFHAGDDVYTFANNKEYLECIWDAGGHDTIDLSNQTRNQVIDLREGNFSSIGIRNDNQTANGNIGIAFNVTIEDAIGGAGNDKITGNTAANYLKGGAGNDTLDGGDGSDQLDGGLNADAMIGGKGDDTYLVDNAGDTISETFSAANGGGVDIVQARVNYSIAAFANIENLALAGGAGNINATGNAITNAVIGNEGNNVLDGGGGVDLLFGGAGNDTYVIDTLSDVVNEQGNTDAHDGLQSATVLFSGLSTDIEDYSYTGGAAWAFTGSAVDNKLSGGTNADALDGALGNDVLLGNSGNDTLIGGTGDDWLDGGAGNDKMKGGIGNDTYTIDAATDTIDEEGSTDSDDTVRSGMTISLAALANGVIEHAVLTGAGAVNATGTGIANKLTGNDGANTLDGGGGADTLDGGKGNDLYVVDNAGDKIVESTAGAAGGTDTVKSSLSFSLASFANVENLTLTDSAANGTGNASVNVITGTDGNNILNGLSGADTLVGGKGDDTYVVNQIDDVVTETLSYALGGGIDLVFAGASYSIAAFANVENLVLGAGAGIGDITGNAGANALIGNAFNNVLDGGGNADLLFGGAGNDTYVIDNAGDVIDEQGNTDTSDEVRSATVLLSAIAGIENYGYSGAAAWNFTGTSIDNKLSGGSNTDALDGADGNDTLFGNNGNDTLIGGAGDDWLDGGAGNDKMFGGSGNDTYTIDTAGDVIDEEGNTDSDDTVRSSITISLATLAGGAIEHAVLTGAAAINATGTGSANKLTGNDGANRLDGSAGADTLDGGKGNDTYVVDEAGDKVIESIAGATGGTDTIESSLSYSLASLANVENLTLTNAATTGTGNGLANVLTGNDGNNTLDGAGGADTLAGGKGDDTYVVDTASDVISETITNALGGGTDTVLAYVNYSIASFANVENLILIGGAGNINATGNATANALIGNEGNNTLDGGGGGDLLFGGAGNDVYLIDNPGDVANEQGNTDTDDELRSANILLGAMAGIEHYTYTGTAAWNFAGNALDNKVSGGTGNDTLDGAGGNDTLLGNNGNDTLIGGIGNDWLEGGAGNDAMKGGAGNDTYLVSDAGDTIDEEGNADSADIVRTTVTVNLASLGAGTIEQAILLGAAAIDVTGNNLVNLLTGNDAANTLDGGGGADVLTGGKGDDTYVVDNAGDQVVEAADGGIDTVKSAVLSLNLAAFSNIENLGLIGSANLDLTGNGSANTLTGNDGKNILDGGGGADTLIGGKGDDTYLVDVDDTVSETIANGLGGGIDTIVANFSYSIAALANVDNIILTGTAVSATGNAGANVLLGNSGVNQLDGGGGADVLVGGADNDIYVLDNVGDVVNEETNTDTDDEVRSSVLIAGAIAGIENYTYTGAAAWTFTGTSVSNDIRGGSGNDVLSGGAGDDWITGGAGKDLLKGGSGNDTYYIDDLGDTIDEEGNTDVLDYVIAAVSVDLVAMGALGVENITLVYGASNATGNNLANFISGTDGANVLDGGGGVDNLGGGQGDDTYVVDDVGDVVWEAAGYGVDTVASSKLSLNLTSYSEVENLALLGSANLNLTGDGFKNTLTGNSGNNILTGGGGADTLVGGLGDDTYMIDGNDAIIENALGGFDTVIGNSDIDIYWMANIEAASLTEAAGNAHIYGSDNGDTLIGNSGNNALAGLYGNDRLFGGAGNDTLNGWYGNDYLCGGDGIDDLQLGDGRDTIDFNHLSEKGDTTGGFTLGASGDIVDMHDLLVDIGYAGSNPFADGYVIFSKNGSFTDILIDADGSGGAGGSVMLTSVFGNMTQADTANYIV